MTFIPSDVETEKYVLGACIESEQILDSLIAEGMNPDDFSVSEHVKLCTLLLEMSASGTPVDLLSVARQLYRKNSIEGLSDLCFGAVLSVRHQLGHLRRLKAIAAKRQQYHNLIQQAESLLDVSVETDFPVGVAQ